MAMVRIILNLIFTIIYTYPNFRFISDRSVSTRYKIISACNARDKIILYFYLNSNNLNHTKKVLRDSDLILYKRLQVRQMTTFIII